MKTQLFFMILAIGIFTVLEAVILGPGYMPKIIRDNDGNLIVVDGNLKRLVVYKGSPEGNFGSPEFIDTPLPDGKKVAFLNITKDKNGDIHGVFANGIQFSSNTFYYFNNIGGTWKTPVEIFSSIDHTILTSNLLVDDNLSVFFSTGDDDYGNDILVKITNVASTPKLEKQVTWEGRDPKISLNSNNTIDVVYLSFKQTGVYWRQYDLNLNLIKQATQISKGVSQKTAQGIGGKIGPDGGLHYFTGFYNSGQNGKFFYNNTKTPDQQALISNFSEKIGERDDYTLFWEKDTIFVLRDEPGAVSFPQMFRIINNTIIPGQRISDIPMVSESHYSPGIVAGLNGGFHIVYKNRIGLVEFVSFNTGQTSIQISSGHLKENLSIAAFPNPFRIGTKINFSNAGNVFLRQSAQIQILNPMGVSLLETTLPPGKNFWHWSGFDSKRNEVPPGLYFVKIKTQTGMVAVERIVKNQ